MWTCIRSIQEIKDVAYVAIMVVICEITTFNKFEMNGGVISWITQSWN